jgi:hypothetical protein
VSAAGSPGPLAHAFLSLAGAPGRFVRRFVRLFRLDPGRRSLLLRAVALLWKHRLRLWFRPFRMPEAAETGSPASSPLPEARWPSPGLIGWAVTAASRLVPRSTCLVRALAARSLCRRYGYPCRLQLGARRGDAGDLEAHAWLEIGDEVIIGGGEVLGDYTPFSPARKRGEGGPAS